MKALILAGGKGTRLRPITFSMAKQLVPVANKPVLEYGIEALIEAGIRDFGIIIGPTGEEVRAALGDGSRWNIDITYIEQPDPLGLAHAVMTAQPFLGDEDFIMYLGDNMLKSSLGGLRKEFEEHRPAATILLTEVPNPQDFGVAVLTDGKVTNLEEKPKEPKSSLALVGVYLFDRRIHDSIARLKPSGRGEYEITEAIQGLIDEGLEVRSHIVEGWWKDTGTVEAMLEANRLVMEDITSLHQSEPQNTSVEGRVQIGKNCVIEDCLLRGPIIIGDNCVLRRSFVGPFTAIDSGCQIEDSEVQHSIIMADCHIRQIPQRLEGCLLGRGVDVKKAQGLPKSLRLVMGDNSSAIIP